MTVYEQVLMRLWRGPAECADLPPVRRATLLSYLYGMQEAGLAENWYVGVKRLWRLTDKGRELVERQLLHAAL